MKIYRRCPKEKNARRAWAYFSKKNNEFPKSIWKMPNNFKNTYSVEGGGWGLWIADYGTWRDYFDPTTDIQSKAKNVYDFIKKQGILEQLKIGV